MSVLAPVGQIRALAHKNITERRMSAVGRAGQQHEIAVNLAREKYRVAVERKERILNSRKRLKISRLRHTDRRAVEILTPDNIISILYLHQTRIVCVYRHERFSVLVHEIDLVLVEIPVNRILASSEINIRNAVRLLPAEHTDESILIRHYRTVKNSCNPFYRISADDRVLLISPNRRIRDSFRALLPRHVRHCRANHFVLAHNPLPLSAASAAFFDCYLLYFSCSKNARFFLIRSHRCATHSTERPGSCGVLNT